MNSSEYEAVQSIGVSDSRRNLWIDLILIGLIGLIAQGFWTWRVVEPTYMDAYYYTTNGQRIADGNGFTENIIWQYLDNPEELPAPSHTYWMPFTSILSALGFAILDSFRGAQLPFWILGGLLPLLSYGIARILAGERWQLWAAALFTAAGSYYSAFMAQPSTFAPFAWAGASCLLFIGLANREYSLVVQRNWQNLPGIKTKLSLYLFLIGVMSGFAHLTRADGLLLLLVGVFFWLLISVKGNWVLSNSSDTKGQIEVSNVSFNGRLFLRGLLILLVGYLLVTGFWLIRNWRVTGMPLPQGGSQSLFLTSYDDLFAFGRSIDLQSYLNWGVENILKSKLNGISIGVQNYAAVLGSIFLLPFIVIGLIASLKDTTRRLFVWPVTAYAVILFAAMTLLFTFPGIRGSLFHSSVAAWPWVTVLAAFGIGISVDWVASRLPHWQPEKAKRRFSMLFILIAFIVGFVIAWPRTGSIENGERLGQIGKSLPSGAIVFSGNPPALNYYSGLAALSIPNEPTAVLLEAAQKYGASHLILDENHPQPLDDLYHSREQHPDIRLLDSYDNLKLFRFEVPDSD